MKSACAVLAAILLVPALAVAESTPAPGPVPAPGAAPATVAKPARAAKVRGETGELEGGGLGRYLSLRGALKLTEDQAKQIDALRAELMKAQVKRQADVKTARIDMQGMAAKNPPDFAGLRESAKRVSAVELEAKLAGIDAREKAWKLLTPEQQQKLPGLMQERRARRRGMKK